MNVLHIGTEKSWRGGENQILLLAIELRKDNQRFQVQQFFCFLRGSAAAQRFKDEGFEVCEISSSVPLAAWQIARHCQAKKIDLIAAHTSKAHSLGLFAKILNTNVKLVVHRRVQFSNSNWFSNRKYLSPKINLFICVSQAVSETLLQKKIPADKISTVYSTIDAAKFKTLPRAELRQSWAKECDVDADAIWLGVTSALTKEKGLDVFIESLSGLKNKNFVVLIAGQGALEMQLKAKVKEFRLQDKVKFLGFLTQPEKLIAALDVFVMPSLQEGLGTAALEAQACGVTVVTSDAGGLKEVVKNKETGLVAAAGNSQALSSQLNLAMSDESLRKLMIEKAKAQIENKFSLTNMVEQTHKNYLMAMQTPG